MVIEREGNATASSLETPLVVSIRKTGFASVTIFVSVGVDACRFYLVRKWRKS